MRNDALAMLRSDDNAFIGDSDEADREPQREWETGLRSQATTTRTATDHQRDTVMNETTFYEGTMHEPATCPTPASRGRTHETITKKIANHETPELDIRPREDEPRSPRPAEEAYEYPYPNREPHPLRRRRESPCGES